MFFISSFKVISAAVPGLKILFRIAASVADLAAVNPDGNRTLLANNLSKLLIKDKPVFSNGPRSLGILLIVLF